MKKQLIHGLILVLCATITSEVLAQSLQDRIARVRAERAQGSSDERAAAIQVANALAMVHADVDLQATTAKDIVQWIRTRTGLNMVVNWSRLEDAGVDPNEEMDIVGTDFTTVNVLNLLVEQLSFIEPVMWEPSPGYVEILTKEQANQRLVTIVYPIKDLLFHVPDFEAQQGGFGGGGQGGFGGQGGIGGGGFGGQQGFGGGGFGGQGGFGGGQQGFGGGGGFGGQQGGFGGNRGGGSFGGGRGGGQENIPSQEERAEEIVELIRETVEPDLWRENGGTVASIRHYNGNLVVRAPNYVHRQIGRGTGVEFIEIPARGSRASASSAAASNRTLGGSGLRTTINRRYVGMNIGVRSGGAPTLRNFSGQVGAVGGAPIGSTTGNGNLLYDHGHEDFGIQGRD